MGSSETKPQEPYDPNKKYKDFEYKDTNDFRHGPMSDDKRKCRDCCCCIIFIIFLCGCVVTCVLGAHYGNPDIILYPYDEDGNQCGQKDLKEYKYLYFYNTLNNIKDGNISNIINAVCVKECPDDINTDSPDITIPIVLSCWPTQNNQKCEVSKDNYYNATGVMNRYCFPKIVNDETLDDLPSQIIDGEEYIKKKDLENYEKRKDLINFAVVDTDKLISWMTDLYECWPILLASLGWSLIIGLFYLLFTRFCAGVLVYIIIILVLACFIILGFFFHKQANKYEDVDDTAYHKTMIGLGCFCYTLAILWFIFILCMCNRIRLAANIMKVTSKYIHQTCSILFMPFLFFFITGAWYVYWVIISLYLYSSGELKESKVIANIEWDYKIRYAWWFHLFSLIYMNEFLKALSQFVYASSACIWYYSHDKGTDEKPIKTSFKRAFKYHWGSLAFGSLIIAIIRFIMFFMEYVKKKVDQTLGEKTKKGKCYRCIICCCQCCMECVARTMEFINRHAYVQIALKGDSFCVSAFEGFAIIVKNLGRFSALTLIGGFFNLIGVIFIGAASGMVGYLVITEVDYFADKLNSPVLPTFVMTMLGFIVGASCMSVFGTSSDALMHSFLMDEEINKGQPKHFRELQQFMEDER